IIVQVRCVTVPADANHGGFWVTGVKRLLGTIYVERRFLSNNGPVGQSLMDWRSIMSSSTMTPPGTKVTGDYIEEVMTTVRSKNPAEPEFHQAVQEVFESL